MKQFPYFVFLVVMFLSGCGGLPGLAAPTSTPLPTMTLLASWARSRPGMANVILRTPGYGR